jgi:predicted nucleic acid-binding protein
VTEPEVREALEGFWSLPIRFSWSQSWVTRALEIARSVGLSTVYDSIYLACADEYDAALLTCDESFCGAFGADLPARVKLVGR